MLIGGCGLILIMFVPFIVGAGYLGDCPVELMNPVLVEMCSIVKSNEVFF